MNAVLISKAIVNSKRVKIAEDKRSRKHKRIPRLLRQKIVRGNPPYWLPTHLWQVRHMHVQKIWGWVLPYCHQSRRVRAASRVCILKSQLSLLFFFKPLCECLLQTRG